MTRFEYRLQSPPQGDRLDAAGRHHNARVRRMVEKYDSPRSLLVLGQVVAQPLLLVLKLGCLPVAVQRDEVRISIIERIIPFRAEVAEVGSSVSLVVAQRRV